jgi:hypothetical protein
MKKLLLFIPIYKTAIALLGINLIEVTKVLKGIIFASFGMAIVLLLLNFKLEFSLLINLIIKLFLSAFTYGILIFIFEKRLISQVNSKMSLLISRK